MLPFNDMLIFIYIAFFYNFVLQIKSELTEY